MTPQIMQELKEIKQELSEIRVVQGVQTEQLKVHIRRSEAAEANIDMLRREFEPVKLATVLWATCGKIAVAIAGLVATYWKLFHDR